VVRHSVGDNVVFTTSSVRYETVRVEFVPGSSSTIVTYMVGHPSDWKNATRRRIRCRRHATDASVAPQIAVDLDNLSTAVVGYVSVGEPIRST